MAAAARLRLYRCLTANTGTVAARMQLYRCLAAAWLQACAMAAAPLQSYQCLVASTGTMAVLLRAGAMADTRLQTSA
jgi:hypothetical protein